MLELGPRMHPPAKLLRQEGPHSCAKLCSRPRVTTYRGEFGCLLPSVPDSFACKLDYWRGADPWSASTGCTFHTRTKLTIFSSHLDLISSSHFELSLLGLPT